MTLSLRVHSQFSSTFPDNEADEDKGLRGPWLSVVGETSTGKKKNVATQQTDEHSELI